MFDVTPDDIARLKDDDLRELVARLAAAELVRHGQSVHAVTDGGHQDAPDGGADVRVSLETGALAGPNLPRANIVYQVKRPDMPRNAILREMRPGGQLRPVIAELMAAGGAYIIVSSQGSTADRPLRSRCAAMREALEGYPNADQLYTDFYDRSRVANWAREHPGIVLWARETLGHPISGWHSHGNWAAQNSRPEDEYLVDEKVKVRFDAQEGADMTVAGAITRLRAALNVPGSSLRLVGLSGVGKTRLAQALFDHRLGDDALPPAAAVYTNFQDRLTNPQPEIMATQLVAQQRRAILIVDNCGVGTHRALTQICGGPSSTVSLLTIEYDVHDDEPEDTQVVEMGFASDLFIEDLIRARYKDVSRENRNTIALVSGGNARIAIAIAETVRVGDRLAGLRSSEIFDRLFHQRSVPDPELLRAAEACSLVYSFEGETEAGNQAELPLLAELAGLSLEVFFRHVQTLSARELVQSRFVWRALLPHALANRLAERALDNVLESRIRRHIIDSGNQRLLRSFAYRLSFLHASSRAVAWCQEFLRPSGILGQVLELTPEQRLMLSYVAPVVPGDVLSAFERAADLDHEEWLNIEHSCKEILRQIAWDRDLFARCVALFVRTVRANRRKYEVDNAVLILANFCQPIFSGTHATADQIFELIEQWLADNNSAVQNLGRNSLTRTLVSQFHSRDSFNFGARKRDGGRHPQSQEEWIEWYTRGLGILERLAQPGGIHTEFAREEFTRQVRSLWAIVALRRKLSAMFTSLAAGRFWRDAWTTVRSMLRYGPADPEGQELLHQLEQNLAPRGLSARVMAEIHADEGRWARMEPGEDFSAVHQRMEETMASLGRELACDLPTLRELVPELMVQHGLIEELCVGLGQEASVEQQVWEMLTIVWSRHREQSNSVPSPYLLRGFLRGLVSRGNVDVEHYLTQCFSSLVLAAALPALQAAVGFSIEGLSRIESKYSEGLIPVKQMEWLRGAVHQPVEVQHAALTLLVHVANDDLGIRTAIDAIQTWLNIALQPGAIPDPVVVESCQRILERVSFAESDSEEPYRVVRLAEIGIRGQRDVNLASVLSTRMCLAAVTRYSLYYEYEDLILLLLERTPDAMLTALCHSDQRLQMAGASLLENDSRDGQNRLARVEPARIAAWCAVAPTLRIPFAMRVIPAVTTDAESGQAHLTDHAMAILRISDDPLNALANLVERVEQETYRNSRGSMLEHNAAALDDVMDLHDDVYRQAARTAQLRLRAEAAEELHMENDRDRRRNERFEP